MEEFLYKDLTYTIRGACFEVYKKFGGAFKEKVIENALFAELEGRKLKVERQKQIEIYYKERKVGIYIPDFIINDLVLLELKSKPRIYKEDERQFWLYLQGSPYKIGLLVNFGPEKLEVIRRVYDKARHKESD